MPTFRNVSTPARPVDLDTGEVLAPGATGEASDSERLDSLVAAHLLAVVGAAESPVESSAPVEAPAEAATPAPKPAPAPTEASKPAPAAETLIEPSAPAVKASTSSPPAAPTEPAASK